MSVVIPRIDFLIRLVKIYTWTEINHSDVDRIGSRFIAELRHNL